MDNLAQV